MTLTSVRSLALNPLAGQSTADDAVADLVRTYGQRVWRSLKYLGVKSSELPDACQEVFLVVHRRREDFRGDSHVATWLYGICLGVARNLRRRQTARAFVPVDDYDEAVDASQERDVERDRVRAALHSALSELSEEQREVFVLYEIEELEMSRVAELVGCPLFTAYSRLRAARRALARRLEAFRKERA